MHSISVSPGQGSLHWQEKLKFSPNENAPGILKAILRDFVLWPQSNIAFFSSQGLCFRIVLNESILEKKLYPREMDRIADNECVGIDFHFY